MNDRLKAIIRRLDRQFAFSAEERLHRLASRMLPPLTCVDVGASYYPHPPWELLRRSAATAWIAVEPNAQNAGYVERWAWPSSARLESIGLSEHGGEQTLYVTHVDSGSSLLPPVINDNMTHRVYDAGYFFPVTEKRIPTRSLPEVLNAADMPAPVVVKLDTQGTELSILRGAQPLFDQRRIVGVEAESTLLAEPLMVGSGKFAQLCELLEANGLELLQLKPIEAPPRRPAARLKGRHYLNECDTVFALKQHEALKASPDHALALFGFYLCYALYDEAAALLEKIPGLDERLHAASTSVAELRAALNA